MTQRKFQLLFAGVVSALGVVLSGLIFIATQPKQVREESHKNPIATVFSVSHQVQRTESHRIIGKSLRKGERLYLGDQIVALYQARVEINLSQGGIFELNPQSKVKWVGNRKLQLHWGAIEYWGERETEEPLVSVQTSLGTLTFQRGNVLIEKSVERGLIFTVKKGEVYFKNSKTQIEQVYQAQLMGGGILPKRVQVFPQGGVRETQRTLVIQQPLSHENVYLKKNQPVLFSWTGVDPNHLVALFVGKTSTDLDETKWSASGTRSLRRKGGFLKAFLPPGKKYWKLVVKNRKGQSVQESEVLTLNLIQETPPSPLYPTRDEYVTLTNSMGGVRFSWSNPAHYREFEIFISSHPKFLPTKTVREKIQGASQYTRNFQTPGKYYWKIIGIHPSGERLDSRQRASFFVELDKGFQFPPRQRKPVHQAAFFQKDIAQGLSLEWSKKSSAEKYLLTVSSGKVKKQREVSRHFEYLKKLPPGRYQWTVSAVNAKGEKGVPSNQRVFYIVPERKVMWRDGDRLTYQYTTQKPSLSVSWKPIKGVTRWRLRYAESGGELKQAPWQYLKGRATSKHFKKEIRHGLYTVEVQALGQGGIPIARTSKRRVKVEAKALPQPPRLVFNGKRRFIASERGTATIRWKPVPEGKAYRIQLFSKSKNKKIKELKSKKTSTRIRNLLPGSYRLRVSTIDLHGREGKVRTVPLTVPRVSNVRAPSLKKLKRRRGR